MTNTHKLTAITKPDRREEQIQLIQIALMEERRTAPHNYFVGERERRKEQLDGDFNPPFGDRKTLHNYDSPPND